MALRPAASVSVMVVLPAPVGPTTPADIRVLGLGFGFQGVGFRVVGWPDHHW